MKQTLFLLLGYPGSGKSTFAKQLSIVRSIPRVSSDDLRRRMYDDIAMIRDPKNNPAVFGALDYTTESLLKAGHSVLYDTNNNRRIHRNETVELAARCGASSVILWIKTPLEVARQREASRALEPSQVAIPNERYQQLVRSLEAPVIGEVLFEINGELNFTDQLRNFDEFMQQYDA